MQGPSAMLFLCCCCTKDMDSHICCECPQTKSESGGQKHAVKNRREQIKRDSDGFSDCKQWRRMEHIRKR